MDYCLNYLVILYLCNEVCLLLFSEDVSFNCYECLERETERERERFNQLTNVWEWL